VNNKRNNEEEKKKSAEIESKKGTWDEVAPELKVPASLKQVLSTRAKVEITAPGNSYNPDKEEHKAVIIKAVEEQVKKQAEMKYILNSLKPRKIRTKDELEDSDEEEEEAEEGDSVQAPKVNLEHVPRKTQVEINKEKRKRKMARLERRKKEQKLFSASFDANVPQFIDEAVKDEEKAVQRAEKNKEKKVKKLSAVHRLGSDTYIQPDIEVLPTDELPSSLRVISNQKYNLVQDRYRSFQERNLVEFRLPKSRYPKQKQKTQTLYRIRDYDREEEARYKHVL